MLPGLFDIKLATWFSVHILNSFIKVDVQASEDVTSGGQVLQAAVAV